MKNKAMFIFSIVLSIGSLILIFVCSIFNLLLLLLLSFICFIMGIMLFARWSTDSYRWICDECGETFEITLKQNVLGVNSGLNYKNLYCPKCHKKTMCKGKLKQ